MKTVTIIEDFEGYPDGTNASRREFLAGTTESLPDDFADLIVTKGHATAGGVLPAETGEES